MTNNGGFNYLKFVEYLKNSKIEFSETTFIPEKCKDLIRNMLAFNEADRIAIYQAVENIKDIREDEDYLKKRCK